MYYSASDSVRQALTAEFSNQMKAVGINVLYEGLGSWDELYTKMYSDPITWGWGSNSAGGGLSAVLYRRFLQFYGIFRCEDG